jgi:predicted NAD/FAD-binding protein
MSAPRRAVVGSGIAGLAAAHVLRTRGPVTLYEADSRLGGHADTHEVEVDGRTVGVDTGFIVHNDRTYPTLLRLFAELGVATRESDMSMSVRDDGTGLEYAGARAARGLFPRLRNLTDPAYLRMLAEVRGFHREARALLALGSGDGGSGDGGAGDGCAGDGGAGDSGDDSQVDVHDRDETLGSFARRCGFSPYFSRHFLEPVVAAVWSCDPEVALDYPARYLFEFLEHHGMLTVFGSPTWRTVTGGSRRYVEALAAGIADVRLSTPVLSVVETADGVVVTDAHGVSDTFDSVVIAAHPHQALAMLGAPTQDQRDVLGAIRYSSNVAQLHTDESVLPRSSGARASWNYWRRSDGWGEVRGEAQGAVVLVTYDLTRLQRLDVPGRRFLVTLNGVDCVDQGLVIDTMHYEHPLYTPESVAAQRRLPEVNTARIAFAGAYHGWGFHEDGARSGVVAAAALGVPWAAGELDARDADRADDRADDLADHPTRQTEGDLEEVGAR